MAYYRDLFGSNLDVRGTLESPNIGTLSLEAKQALVEPVTKEEVYKALMGMKSYKAPGLDGFQPIFFKMYWQYVGDDVW